MGLSSLTVGTACPQKIFLEILKTVQARKTLFQLKLSRNPKVDHLVK